MKIKNIILTLTLILFSPLTYAYGYPTTDEPTGLGLIAKNIFGAAMTVEKLIKTLCIATAAALILSAAFQYKKHRKNPVETPLSKVIMSLIIGLALLALSFIPFQAA